jgi:hypothetical protein
VCVGASAALARACNRLFRERRLLPPPPLEGHTQRGANELQRVYKIAERTSLPACLRAFPTVCLPACLSVCLPACPPFGLLSVLFFLLFFFFFSSFSLCAVNTRHQSKLEAKMATMKKSRGTNSTSLVVDPDEAARVCKERAE